MDVIDLFLAIHNFRRLLAYKHDLMRFDLALSNFIRKSHSDFV